MADYAEKPHKVEIKILSISNGKLNSRTTHEEFAETPEELVMKNFVFADKVVDAVNNAALELAAPFLPKA